MIYFIQDTKSRAIKIGTSRNPAARLKELQTAHAHALVLLAVMDGGVTEERKLHQRFVRLHGEWFEPTPELITFVRECAMPVPRTAHPKRQLMSRATVYPVSSELTPMDMETCTYSVREVWTCALCAVQVRNGEYRDTPERIAAFMTTKGTTKHRVQMNTDIQRMVLAIRAMPKDEVDRILRNIPPEQVELRLKCGITEAFVP